MTPNYEAAAIKALELLKEKNVRTTPIDSCSLLQNYPGVRIITYTRMAEAADMEREHFVPMFGNNVDASTFFVNLPEMPDVRYVVAYNMRLSYELTWRGIARELGHIVLGHDGETRPSDVRRAEAMCFAHHLLSPRPVVRLLQSAGFPLTMNVLSDTTCCSAECVEDLREIPGVHVPAELNREVRDLFAQHINEYILFHRTRKDTSHLVDLGTFMDGYEE